MKTGIELIKEERNDQIHKHNRTIEFDSEYNNSGELRVAAQLLLETFPHFRKKPNSSWDEDIWRKMKNKSYKDRLIIAGALIAAEIDRLLFEEEKERIQGLHFMSSESTGRYPTSDDFNNEK